MRSRPLFSVTRYPVVEILCALIAGVAGVVTDKSDQPLFSFVLYALSGSVGLMFRPAANRTPLRATWVYFAAGIAMMLAEILYFGRQETGILDIFLIPLGLGIMFATFGSVVHRLSSTAS